MNLRFSLLGMAVVFSASIAQASVITWLPAANIANDNDVVTTGTLFQAGNIGAAASPEINGVTFSGITSNGTIGNVTLSGGIQNPYVGSMAGNTTLLSANYTTLMNSINWGGTAVNFRISNLTVGNNYLVQFWENYRNSGQAETLYTRFNDGNGNTVDARWRVSANNNLGQFVTGTFVADASGFQDIGMTNGGIAVPPAIVLNAFQVRVVPEPGTLALLAFGSLAVMKFRRKNVSK